MGSENITVSLHSNIRWLSRGKLFNRLFELKAEVADFLTEIKSELVKYFQDELWICSLAYLYDIFDRISNLNIQLQRFNTNILILRDKVQALKKKLTFWENDALPGNCVSFQYLPEFCVKMKFWMNMPNHQ
jgi:hypothetical protein